MTAEAAACVHTGDSYTVNSDMTAITFCLVGQLAVMITAIEMVTGTCKVCVMTVSTESASCSIELIVPTIVG